MEIKRKDNKLKLNVFDIIILLLLIIGIALVVVKYVYFNNESMNDEKAIITYSVYNIADFNALEIKPTSKMYLTKDNTFIGVINEASIKPTKIQSIGPDGKVIIADHPNRCDVTGTAEIYGKWSENGFMLNGKDLISLGSEVTIYTTKNTFTFTVVGISN